MYYKKRNDFLIGADIMRPGKAEAMRDMCNPKRFGKHIHMHILTFHLSVYSCICSLSMKILDRVITKTFLVQLFYKNQKVQNKLSARAQDRDNSEAFLFSDCNACPYMILKFMKHLNSCFLLYRWT